MPRKAQKILKKNTETRKRKQTKPTLHDHPLKTNQANELPQIVRRTLTDNRQLKPAEIMALKGVVTNQSVVRMLKKNDLMPRIQAKLEESASPARQAQPADKSEEARPSPGRFKTIVEDNWQPFRATIRKGKKPRISEPFAFKHAPEKTPWMAPERDAGREEEVPEPPDMDKLVEQTTAPTERINEPAEGESVSLPEIKLMTPKELIEDSIVSVLGYTHSISRSGELDPGDFGATWGYDFSMSDVNVFSLPSAYLVTASVNNPIHYQVRDSAGPNKEVNIESESDPQINATNYSQAAADLTPNKADLGGRPPRTKFWSRDFTDRHERFHATEGATHCMIGTLQAMTWLSSQVASNANQVKQLVSQVPARVSNARAAAMAFPGRENRAYGDGVPVYQARATAIKNKGDAGGYAAAAAGAAAGTAAGMAAGAAGAAGAAAAAATAGTLVKKLKNSS
jgi:hypothetical protein